MRIVYDDAKLPQAVTACGQFMKELDVQFCVEYEYGTHRVQDSLVKKELNDFFRQHQFHIGNTVTHKHGIGNNCQYPLYYTGDEKEFQQVGYININSGMFGEVFVSINDYDQSLAGDYTYELTPRGVTIEKHKEEKR